MTGCISLKVTLVTLTFRFLFLLFGRLAQNLASEPADCQSSSQFCPSPAHTESTHSSAPSESPETFSDLLLSLASSSQGQSGSSHSSTENLSFVDSGGSSPIMADQKRKPPSYRIKRTLNKGNLDPVREIQNPAYEEANGSQQEKKPSLPLPDYETLYIKKRHGVQGQIRWDNLVAEVNQKHKDYPPELMGPEMSVDGPAETAPNPKLSVSHDYAALRNYQKTKPVTSKKAALPVPSKPAASPVPQTVVDSASSNRASRDEEKIAQVSLNKEAPIAKPRQRVGGTEPKKQEESAVKTSVQTSSSSNVSNKDQKEKNSAQPDPFTNTDVSKDSSAQLSHNQEADTFTSNLQTEQKPEHTNADNLLVQDKTADSWSASKTDHRKPEEGSKQLSPAFQRNNSQRGKKILASKTHSENKTLVLQDEPESKETNQASSTSDVSATPQPRTDVKTHVSLHAGEDPTAAEPFHTPSSLAPSGHLPVVLEEPASQAENWSGAKTLLRAWVSPSEVQPVSTQNSSGGGLALIARR